MTDSLYRERAHLVAALAAMYPSVIGYASDELGWYIVYVDTWEGQLSWHISPEDIDLFDHVESANQFDPRMQWDGHSTEEKYKRVRKLTEHWSEVMKGAC